MNDDIEKILNWGKSNLVQFNSSKTQLLSITKKKAIDGGVINMSGTHIQESDTIDLLGLKVDKALAWDSHIKVIARRASARLAVLARSRAYFTSSDVDKLYKDQIRPVLEYCCHIWGGAAATHLHLLDRINTKAAKLIASSVLTDNLQPLAHRRSVSELCLFYKYFFGRGSVELNGCVPCPKVFPYASRLSKRAHSYCVEVPKVRLSVDANSFFTRVARKWNALPQTVFPDGYDIQDFKLNIHKHLLQPG
jgi:hypothetical protein